MHTTKRLRAIGAAAALLMLAACSESTDDSGPAAPADQEAPDTRTTRGVTDDTVTVGGVVFDGYFSGARVGVEARIKQANDAGGVHGRTIEVIEAEDDGNDAAKGLEITQRLVEQEKVFALLPLMGGNYGGGDYIVENSVPAFGWGTHPAFCGNEVAFGVTGCVTNPSLEVGSNALGTALEAHFGDTDRSIAFIGEDNDAGRGGLALLEASVADKGFDVVMSEPSLPAPPDPLGDPSPFVSQLLSADGGEAPDVIYMLATLSGTQMAAALQGAGYEGMIVTPSYSPLLLGANGYDGVWVNTQIDMDPELPANAELLEAVAAVDPEARFDLAVAVGYWSADFFIEALEATGEDLTVETLLATLNGGDFSYEVEGVVGPSTWPENHDKPVPCSAMTQVVGSTFEPTIPLGCGENIEID